MPITNRLLEPETGGRRDEILHYNIDFDQDFDRRTGQPIGRPILNNIVISITRDSEKNAPFYVEWQLEPAQTYNLKICFYEDQNLKRTIKITDAYLVNYVQDSSAPGTIEETITLSPQSAEIDGVVYSREDYM